MPRVKSLPKRAKTVTRVYDPDTGNRVKITQIDPTKKYTIRFKSGTVQTRKLSKAFLKPRAKQSRYKNLRKAFSSPKDIGLTDRATGFRGITRLPDRLEIEIKQGFVVDSFERSPAWKRFYAQFRQLPHGNLLAQLDLYYTIESLEITFEERLASREFAVNTLLDEFDLIRSLSRTALLIAQNQQISLGRKFASKEKYDNEFTLSVAYARVVITPKNFIAFLR